MSKIIFGIDNGSTGSIGILSEWTKPCFLHTPIKEKERSYTKETQYITRVDFAGLLKLFKPYCDMGHPMLAILERPFVNPGMFKASILAVRSLEGTLNALEHLGIPYQYIDSKAWQHVMLSGITGRDELKEASKDIGIRLYPQFEKEIRKQKDGDGILIATWAQRTNL